MFEIVILLLVFALGMYLEKQNKFNLHDVFDISSGVLAFYLGGLIVAVIAISLFIGVDLDALGQLLARMLLRFVYFYLLSVIPGIALAAVSIRILNFRNTISSVISSY